MTLSHRVVWEYAPAMISRALPRMLLAALATAALCACGGPSPDETASEDSLTFGGGGWNSCITQSGDDAAGTKSCARTLDDSWRQAGHINWSGDVDWWKFYAGGGRFSITCGSSYVYCRVYDSSQMLASFVGGAQSVDVSGWTYIQVNSAYYSFTPYYTVGVNAIHERGGTVFQGDGAEEAAGN